MLSYTVNFLSSELASFCFLKWMDKTGTDYGNAKGETLYTRNYLVSWGSYLETSSKQSPADES